MKDILKNINSSTYTLSAIIIGYSLIDDLSPSEQNSIGNWLMLVGQVLCTNSAQQQVTNSSKTIVNNENNFNHIKNSINKMNNELNKYS